MKTYTEILEREEICAALPAGSRDTLAELERRRDPVLEADWMLPMVGRCLLWRRNTTDEAR